MRVQRKILHLLANNGETGAGFRYVPKLNPEHGIDLADWIIITDKMDGTTTQSDGADIYQRRDKFKKGDPAKFTASEEERYTLEKLDSTNPAYQYIFKAVESYREKLKNACAFKGETVYFECLGDKINARYPGLAPTIRVFDWAIDDEYCPFTEMVALCAGLQLPVVESVRRGNLTSLHKLLEELRVAKYMGDTFKPYPLEGWVIRQGDKIAKIRVVDLDKVEKPTEEAKT